MAVAQRRQGRGVLDVGAGVSTYRAPPAVLPSLRSWPGPLTLCATSNAEDIRRAVAAVVEGFAPEQAARDRAAFAPCPEASPWRFDGPVPRWYIPPPPTGLPGPGRLVRE